MGAPIGSRNAKAYHAAKTQDALKKLTEALDEIRASGARYPSLTSLSKALSSTVGLSDVRLRQNPNYRQLLDEHFESYVQKSFETACRRNKVTALQKEIFGLRLELSNLQASNSRLRAAIEQQLNRSEAAPSAQGSAPPTCSSSSNDFESTAYLVLALMHHVKGFQIDFENEVIVDAASLIGRERVAGPNLCGAFIRWCRDKGLSSKDGV